MVRLFDAQRDAIFTMLHGYYCDPQKDETTRVNATTICSKFTQQFSPQAQVSLINQHQRYLASRKAERHKASQAFFEKLSLIDMLTESERHALVSSACKNLIRVHNGMDNFYNERPFAERLSNLSSGQKIPSTVQQQFVDTIVTCSVGNQYGTANSADAFYLQMIKAFSPREIQIMLDLPSASSVLASRIQSAPRCREKFKSLVQILQPESIPTPAKSNYQYWMQ